MQRGNASHKSPDNGTITEISCGLEALAINLTDSTTMNEVRKLMITQTPESGKVCVLGTKRQLLFLGMSACLLDTSKQQPSLMEIDDIPRLVLLL